MPGLPTPPQGESALALVESPWPQSASLDLREGTPGTAYFCQRKTIIAPSTADKFPLVSSHPAWAPSTCSSVGRLGSSVSEAAQVARFTKVLAPAGPPRECQEPPPDPPIPHFWCLEETLWEFPKAKGPPRGGGEKLGRDLVERKCIQMEAALLGKKLRKPWDSPWTSWGQWPWYSGLSSGK